MEKLDNPTWYSLSESHKDFSVDYGDMKFYKPDYCPFGGFVNIQKTEEGIDRYSSLAGSFYVVGDKPKFTSKVLFQKELVCRQMVLDKIAEGDESELVVELYTHRHKTDLQALVNLVQPGYFNNKTSDLGRYYGIYKEGELVAVTGERMKMEQCTEISAVVTHPQHVRKGYARRLVVHASRKVLSDGGIPYLHVTDDNTKAIELYEKIGFKTRRKISFWCFKVSEKSSIL